jgi:hypothetical protein
VLQRLDAHRGVEAVIGEGQPLQVGLGVDSGVVPGRVADGQIDADVAGVVEVVAELALAGPGIEQARPGRRLVPRPLQQAIGLLAVDLDLFADPVGQQFELTLASQA